MAKGQLGSTKKKTYPFVLSCFEQAGYKLISTEYVGNIEKMHSICPNGHDYFVSFNLFHNRGFRCPECSGNKPYTVGTAGAEFVKYGCVPMFTTYKKNVVPLHVKCPNGHDWYVTLNNLHKHGVHCPKCSGFVTHHTKEHVIETLGIENYKLVSEEYVNANTLMDVLCSKGHSWKVRFGDFNTGYRCPDCSQKGSSLSERELFGVVKSIYPNAKKLRDRSVKISGKPHIGGFDLDIYVPELNLGIEYDGIWTHSVKGLKRGRKHWPDEDLKKYHGLKDDWFMSSKGIMVLHINEADWLLDKESCIKRCLDFLGAS
jgi:hypothetical protein